MGFEESHSCVAEFSSMGFKAPPAAAQTSLIRSPDARPPADPACCARPSAVLARAGLAGTVVDENRGVADDTDMDHSRIDRIERAVEADPSDVHGIVHVAPSVLVAATSAVQATGMWISGLVSGLPASTSRTFTSGSSLSRLARTQPAEPAPSIT
jgi:hypothetical protein